MPRSPWQRAGANSLPSNGREKNCRVLQLERQATAERIDQRIRSALHQASASYPNIRLSRSAAEAARKNLELVTDQYVRGLVSIVDLLDAQNSSLRADQDAENAVYNFLIDWMDVERAAGRFDFLMTQAEREEWFQRLQEFFNQGWGRTDKEMIGVMEWWSSGGMEYWFSYDI